MLGTILSIAGGISNAINIYKFGSTLAKGDDAGRVLGELGRIHAKIERLSDNILYAPDIEGLIPAAGTAHRLGGLREARGLLEPVQAALGGEIVSSGLIETPHKMERAMLENPWAVLEDVRPQHLAARPANPDKVPVLFMHQGMRFIGWQMRGALPSLFNCELRDLPGLGASLTPEVWGKPPQQPGWQSPVPPVPAAQARSQGGGWLDKAKAFIAGPSGGPAPVAPVSRETRAVARPAWASSAGSDKYGRWAEFALGDVRQRMRWIEPGTFQMGSPDGEDRPYRYRNSDESPRHEVRLTKGFWLCDTPVTQALWTAAMGKNRSSFQGPERPVENVSWDDAQEFLKKMNLAVPGLGFGLPTEAQWEYACRAGTEGANYARGGQSFADIAWYKKTSGGQTHPVATRQCNDWGLYDMLGNVWEWCADGQRSYTAKPVIDPAGPLDNASRALRGGSWRNYADDLWAANRREHDCGYRHSDVGFRCCV